MAEKTTSGTVAPEQLQALLSEEQKQQHLESMEMVQKPPCYMKRVDLGEIPLLWKERPTVEDPYFAALLQTSEAGIDRATPTLICEEDEEINMPKKKNSLEELKKVHPDYYKSGSFISSRGTVDVSGIKRLLFEGYNDVVAPPTPIIINGNKKLVFPTQVSAHSNLWDVANSRQNNVHIIRPSHDAWGIKKVALLFCDDFLQRVYELPWWHGEFPTSHSNHKLHHSIACDMQEAVQPVLKVLNIASNQVVRLLFAALPPGVTIPVHHDTGDWVRHTHRVHVPIFVPENDPSCILFQCGPIPHLMQRVECFEGHVFEMNNQAKHMVSNCHASEYRVHMILDYVAANHQATRTRIRLEPGEVVYQTRRSIDRSCDQGTRSAPTYMILGVQKCGTTSLYNYLTQHPLCIPAKWRELHSLDWKWPDIPKMDDRLLSKMRTAVWNKCYHYDELQRYPSCVSGDSTPSYLVHPKLVIPRLKWLFPWCKKFFVMLRNPTARCYSHYKMVTDPNGSEDQKRIRGSEWLQKSFREVILEDFENMKSVGLIPYWNMEHQTFDRSNFQAFVGSQAETDAYNRYQDLYIHQNTGSHSPVLRGMYHLQLRSWFAEFDPSCFHIILLERMAKSINETLHGAFEHLGLPALHEINDTTAKNTREYDPIAPDLESLLDAFYVPQNQYLAEFLSDQGYKAQDWKDIWS